MGDSIGGIGEIPHCFAYRTKSGGRIGDGSGNHAPRIPRKVSGDTSQTASTGSIAGTTSSPDRGSVTGPDIIRRGAYDGRCESSDYLTDRTESDGCHGHGSRLRSGCRSWDTSRANRCTGRATSGTRLSVLGSEITGFTIYSIENSVSAPSSIQIQTLVEMELRSFGTSRCPYTSSLIRNP